MELREGFTVTRKEGSVTEISKNGRVMLSTVFSGDQALLNTLIILGAIPR